jgi:hypothetical protein
MAAGLQPDRAVIVEPETVVQRIFRSFGSGGSIRFQAATSSLIGFNKLSIAK